MCAAKPENSKDTLNANIYFPTVIYTIEKPEFLDPVLKIANQDLEVARKERPTNDVYPVNMTGNLFDRPEIIPFQYYVGQTAFNILTEQGYNLDGFETYFSEMWCQEHYKASGMDQHVHGAGSQIVGFYFLEVPENASRVVFHDPRAGKPLISWAEQDATKATFASNMINFEAKPGLLMFTNAWLPHSFTRNESDKPMKFIHFNLGLRQAININTLACPTPAAEVV